MNVVRESLVMNITACTKIDKERKKERNEMKERNRYAETINARIEKAVTRVQYCTRWVGIQISAVQVQVQVQHI